MRQSFVPGGSLRAESELGPDIQRGTQTRYRTAFKLEPFRTQGATSLKEKALSAPFSAFHFFRLRPFFGASAAFGGIDLFLLLAVYWPHASYQSGFGSRLVCEGKPGHKLVARTQLPSILSDRRTRRADPPHTAAADCSSPFPEPDEPEPRSELPQTA